MQRRGSLLDDGEHATLTFERVYRHSPEHVWDAIATPEGLREWLMCTHALIEGRVGGRIELVSHAFLDRLEAQVDGRALPDWITRFAELRAEYPEWSGHAPDSAE